MVFFICLYTYNHLINPYFVVFLGSKKVIKNVSSYKQHIAAVKRQIKSGTGPKVSSNKTLRYIYFIILSQLFLFNSVSSNTFLSCLPSNLSYISLIFSSPKTLISMLLMVRRTNKNQNTCSKPVLQVLYIAGLQIRAGHQS